jgi:hypothetical protein
VTTSGRAGDDDGQTEKLSAIMQPTAVPVRVQAIMLAMTHELSAVSCVYKCKYLGVSISNLFSSFLERNLVMMLPETSNTPSIFWERKKRSYLTKKAKTHRYDISQSRHQTVT